MTFYEAFTDELSKIAEEKKERSKTLITGVPLASHLTAAGAMTAGLAGEAAGDISKWRAEEKKRPRPKWSHPTKKWGRRLKRGGMIAAIPTTIMAVREDLRRRREDKEKK